LQDNCGGLPPYGVCSANMVGQKDGIEDILRLPHLFSRLTGVFPAYLDKGLLWISPFWIIYSNLLIACFIFSGIVNVLDYMRKPDLNGESVLAIIASFFKLVYSFFAAYHVNFRMQKLNKIFTLIKMLDNFKLRRENGVGSRKLFVLSTYFVVQVLPMLLTIGRKYVNRRSSKFDFEIAFQFFSIVLRNASLTCVLLQFCMLTLVLKLHLTNFHKNLSSFMRLNIVISQRLESLRIHQHILHQLCNEINECFGPFVLSFLVLSNVYLQMDVYTYLKIMCNYIFSVQNMLNVSSFQLVWFFIDSLKVILCFQICCLAVNEVRFIKLANYFNSKKFVAREKLLEIR